MNSTIELSRFRRVPYRSESPQASRPGPVLPAMVAAVGHEHVTCTPYDWDGRKRGRSEFAILQYTLAGEGALSRDERQYAIKPGQVMLLTVPDTHRYWLPQGGHWRFFHVTLYGHEVVRLWRYAVGRLGPVVDIPFESNFIQTAAGLCARLLGRRKFEATDLSHQAYGITMLLLDLARQRSAAPPVGPRKEALDRCIDYCRLHLAEPLGVDQMAALAGYTRHHFTRLFTARTGTSPCDFLIRERLRTAARLLQTTGRPIKDIAQDCGYRDVNYFCRSFRKVRGMSPGDFRRSGVYPPRHKING